MAVTTRNMLPVVEPRRRPTHRDLVPRVTPAPRPAAPARTLAIVALAVLRRASDPYGRPGAWVAPAFAREVDLVRLHLAPIRSRPGLAASFGREAFQSNHAEVEAARPVTAAYAIRWLELGDGLQRPPWDSWLADSTVRVAVVEPARPA